MCLPRDALHGPDQVLLPHGELTETAGDRARESVAWWSAIQIRKGLLLFLGLLLGQLVLMITAAMLVQQTGALFTQNERIQAQTRLLEAQNEIMRGQSADERIRRSISDMRSLNEVDYGRIVEIAKDIRSLSLGRGKTARRASEAFIERNEFSVSFIRPDERNNPTMLTIPRLRERAFWRQPHAATCEHG